MINGMVRIMRSPKGFVDPVNIGEPTEFRMIELVELVLRLVGSSSTIAFMPLPQDDPRQQKLDISLAKSKLDWQPLVGREDGLTESIAYFRKRLQS